MEYPDYRPDLANDPLSDEELQAFDTLLQGLPGEAAVNIEGLDGYLTALVVNPPLLQRLHTREWLPPVWGGDGADGSPFASNRQRKRATVLALRHLHGIACQLRDTPGDWQPIFSVAEADNGELADAEDWCIGFLEAVGLDPEFWEPRFDHPELGPALRPIAQLGGEEAALSAEEAAALDDPARRDELSRAVMDAVLLLQSQPGP
jgi:uncharacterized protein